MLCFSFSSFRSLALLSFLLSFILSLSFLHPFVLSFIFYSFHSLFLGLSLVHSVFPRPLHPLFILTFSLSPLSFICSFFSVSRFVLSLYLSFILSLSFLLFILSYILLFFLSLVLPFVLPFRLSFDLFIFHSFILFFSLPTFLSFFLSLFLLFFLSYLLLLFLCFDHSLPLILSLFCYLLSIPPLGEWDFVVVWFRVHYYYYSLPCSKQWLISHKVFKLSQ